MLNVTVLLLDDGFASTAIAPLEIFHSAGAFWSQLQGQKPTQLFKVVTASIDGAPVRVPCGVALTPEKSVSDIERTDIIMVSTSGFELDPRVETEKLLLPWLRHHHAHGAYIGAACQGSAYLAQAGLLDGREATTHWALADEFARRYPKVKWRPDLMITEDARLLCSGGVSAAMDLSLYLVEKLAGHEVAVQTAKALLLNMPRLSQTGYAMLPFSAAHADAPIRDVETFLQQNFREDVGAKELAARAGMSERTFLRRFKAATGRLPSAYVQALRIEAAKAMLERERDSVQSIALAVGYADVSFFRALFRRATGMNPGEYRARFASLAVRNLDSADLGAP